MWPPLYMGTPVYECTPSVVAEHLSMRQLILQHRAAISASVYTYKPLVLLLVMKILKDEWYIVMQQLFMWLFQFCYKKKA